MMKPKCTSSDGDSTACYKTSFEEGCSFNDSKTVDEELDRFSSEFITKTNTFFELYNSFLYDDVLENASDLENYSSEDFVSDVKVNRNCSNKIETVEDENSDSISSQILYSSSIRYFLEDVEEIPDSPSVSETTNRARNTITFDAPLSKNNVINIKFPLSNLFDVPENLTAHRSVRLNKKYRLKKTLRKSRNKKLIISAETKKVFSSEEISEPEKHELENATAVRGSSEINSSLDVITENEKQVKSLRITRKHFLKNRQDIGKQPENATDVLFDEKEHSEFSSKCEKIPKSKLTRTEKNHENYCTKELNKSKPARNSKKNKVPSCKIENILTGRNDVVKTNYRSFIPDKQNTFVNESNSSKYLAIMVEENIPKKGELRVSSRLAKKPVCGSKKGTSRKKSDPQDKTKIKINCNEKNASNNKAAWKNCDVFRQNSNVENNDLLGNEMESDLVKNEIVAIDKKIDAEQLLESFLSKESNIDTLNLKSVGVVKGNSTKNSHVGRKRSNDDNAEIIPSKKRKRNQVIVKRKSVRNVKCEISSNENFDEHYNTETTKEKLAERVVVRKASDRNRKRNKKLKEESTDITFKLNNSLEDVSADLCHQERSERGNKYIEKVNSSAESHSSYSSPNGIQSSSKSNLLPTKYTAVKSTDTQNSRKTKNKSDRTSKKTVAVKTENILRKNNIVENTRSPIKYIEVDFSRIEIELTAAETSRKQKIRNKKKNSSSKKAALINERENGYVEDIALPVNKSKSEFIKNKIIEDKAFEMKNKVDKKNLSSKKAALTNNREIYIFEDRALPFKEIESGLIKNETVATGEKPNGGQLFHSNPSKKRKCIQELAKRNVKCKISSNEDFNEHYNAKITNKQSTENVEDSSRRSTRNKKLEEESTEMTFKLNNSLKDISSDLCNEQTSETAIKHIGNTISSGNSHTSCNTPNVIQSTSKCNLRPRKYTAVFQNSRKTKSRLDYMSKKEAAVKTGDTLRENKIVKDTSSPIKNIGIDFSKNEVVIITDKTAETETKVVKKNSSNKKVALNNGRENSYVEETALPVNEIGNDFIENKIVTAEKISETKNKFDKKKLSKRKPELLGDRKNSIVEDTTLSVNEIGNDFIENKIVTSDKTSKTKHKCDKKKLSKRKAELLSDRKNSIVEDTALSANEIGSNFIETKIVTADKISETKNKKRKAELLSDTENSIVEDTALPVEEIGSDFISNKMAIANKTFKTKCKVNVEKKNTSNKKVVLKNEDIFKENNLDEHTPLPVNAILAADKSLDAKMKVKFENKSISWENGDILNEKIIAENTDLPFTNESGTNLINNKTASDKIHKSKSIHLFKTRKLKSKNSSMGNSFASVNEKTSRTRMSNVSQSNSNTFLRLFDKIAESSNSGTFSKSNPSITKLVEQRNNSKFATPITVCKELNEKRDVEMLLPDVAPLKKRKQNQELIQINSGKTLKSIISSNRDAVEHNNNKTTKVQSAGSTVVSKSSRRKSKKNKKLDEECNDMTYKLTDSLKGVSTDLCNQERTKTQKKYIENVNSSAEYHSSYNSPCVIQSTLKRNLETRTSTAVELADTQSSNKTRRKADSLIISTNPKSLHNDERVDDSSFIEETEVDSLANLHEKNSKKLQNKESNNLFFDSFSEDPNAMKTYKMQPNSNECLHISQHDKTFNISACSQPGENASLKLSSGGKTTQTKSKSSSTFVDPDFYNELNTPRKKKKGKSFSKQKKRIVSPETELLNEMSCADTISEESANEHTAQNGSNEGQFANSSSNGVPMSSLNSDQFRDFLSSYTFYPLSTHCQILYNHELNCYMLATPIQSPLSLSAQMPSASVNDDNVSSVFAPQNSINSVESTQNVPSLFTNQNVLSKVKPQTTSYTANPQNASVTRSEELSGVSHSNNSVDDNCSMRTRTTKTTRIVKIHQTRDALQKPESKLCINWESVVERSLELIDISFIDNLVKQRYGKSLKAYTVREFCSNPVVVQVLSKQSVFFVTDCKDSGRLDYNFHDSVLDESFNRVLKDVVLFFLEHVYEKTQNECGDALRMISLRRKSTTTKNMVEQFSKFPYDCRIVCKDGYVEAHAIILSTASKYLKDLLTNTGSFGSPRHRMLIMQDFDRKTMLSIKKFIYEGETTADGDVIRCASILQLTCG